MILFVTKFLKSFLSFGGGLFFFILFSLIFKFLTTNVSLLMLCSVEDGRGGNLVGDKTRCELMIHYWVELSHTVFHVWSKRNSITYSIHYSGTCCLVNSISNSSIDENVAVWFNQNRFENVQVNVYRKYERILSIIKH